MIDYVLVSMVVLICSVTLIGFGFVMGNVSSKDQTTHCGLVNASSNECSDGIYQFGAVCEVNPTVPCDID
jgi:hypothetical protein